MNLKFYDQGKEVAKFTITTTADPETLRWLMEICSKPFASPEEFIATIKEKIRERDQIKEFLDEFSTKVGEDENNNEEDRCQATQTKTEGNMEG